MSSRSNDSGVGSEQEMDQSEQDPTPSHFKSTFRRKNATRKSETSTSRKGQSKFYVSALQNRANEAAEENHENGLSEEKEREEKQSSRLNPMFSQLSKSCETLGEVDETESLYENMETPVKNPIRLNNNLSASQDDLSDAPLRNNSLLRKNAGRVSGVKMSQVLRDSRNPSGRGTESTHLDLPDIIGNKNSTQQNVKRSVKAMAKRFEAVSEQNVNVSPKHSPRKSDDEKSEKISPRSFTSSKIIPIIRKTDEVPSSQTSRTSFSPKTSPRKPDESELSPKRKLNNDTTEESVYVEMLPEEPLYGNVTQKQRPPVPKKPPPKRPKSTNIAMPSKYDFPQPLPQNRSSSLTTESAVSNVNSSPPVATKSSVEDTNPPIPDPFFSSQTSSNAATHSSIGEEDEDNFCHSLSESSLDSYDDDDGWASDEFEDHDDTVSRSDSRRSFLSSDDSKSTNQEDSEDKALSVLREIVQTEQTYVSKLQMLAKAKDKVSSILKDPMTAEKMLPLITQIYRLHNDELLPALQTHLNKWPSERAQVGETFKKCAPFMKIYVNYMKNFDQATKLMKECQKKSTLLNDELRMVCSEWSGQPFKSRRTIRATVKLDITAHMLEPVQRIPRYILLLDRYQKYLSPDEEAFNSAKEAVEYVRKQADFLNQQSSHEKFQDKMSELQQNIIMPEDDPVMSASRKFIHEGDVEVVNPATDKREARKLFLFNDMLLICVRAQALGSSKYRKLEKLQLDKMEVRNGEFEDASFHLCTPDKTFTVIAKNEDDRDEWIKVLYQNITSMVEIKKKRAKFSKSRTISYEELPKGIGYTAPIFIPFSEVSMCMSCGGEFSSKNRRHHCKACGAVVCECCSPSLIKLHYIRGGTHRVCNSCYDKLETDVIYPHNFSKMAKGRYGAVAIEQGYLPVSYDKSPFTSHWLELHEGGMLYCYKARLDMKPYQSFNLGVCALEVNQLKEDTIVCIRSVKEFLRCKVTGEEKNIVRWIKNFQKAKEDADRLLIESVMPAAKEDIHDVPIPDSPPPESPKDGRPITPPDEFANTSASKSNLNDFPEKSEDDPPMGMNTLKHALGNIYKKQDPQNKVPVEKESFDKETEVVEKEHSKDNKVVEQKEEMENSRPEVGPSPAIVASPPSAGNTQLSAKKELDEDDIKKILNIVRGTNGVYVIDSRRSFKGQLDNGGNHDNNNANYHVTVIQCQCLPNEDPNFAKVNLGSLRDKSEDC